jgi:hypothetical protein
VAFKLLAGMVLIWVVATFDVTFTETVQEPKLGPTLAGTVPPIKEIVVPTVDTELPVQVVAAFAGLAKVTPVGSVLVKAAGTFDSDSGNAFWLTMEIVNTEVPPEGMVLGVNSRFTWAGKVTSSAKTGETHVRIIMENNVRNKHGLTISETNDKDLWRFNGGTPTYWFILTLY